MCSKQVFYPHPHPNKYTWFNKIKWHCLIHKRSWKVKTPLTNPLKFWMVVTCKIIPPLTNITQHNMKYSVINITYSVINIIMAISNWSGRRMLQLCFWLSLLDEVTREGTILSYTPCSVGWGGSVCWVFLFPLFVRTMKCALWRSVHTVNWTEMCHLLICTQTDSHKHNLHYILTYLQGVIVSLHLPAMIHRGWINMLTETIRNIPHKDY